MTNADCIRRMSDEQLYEFLSEWECGDIDYSITFCDLCKQGGNELNLDCDGCRKHWLQRDAVDVGGLMYWKRNTTFTADTPQTEEKHAICNGCVYCDLPNAFHPCASCVDFSKYVGEVSGDTPQTDFVEDDKCFDCEDFFTCDEHQTDCGWK